MKQYAHLPLLAALLGVVGVGACTDPLAEDVWWLCESHSDCGVGEACFDGLCKPRSYGLTGPDLGLDGQADASQDEDTAAAPADLPPEQDLAGQDPDLAPEADPAEDDVDALDDAEEVAEPDPDPSADVEETPDAEDPADALVAEVDPEPDADVELSEALAEPESEPEPEPELPRHLREHGADFAESSLLLGDAVECRQVQSRTRLGRRAQRDPVVVPTGRPRPGAPLSDVEHDTSCARTA